ncbi:MATE domain protein [Shuttleworthella sp. MSX8B]|nr:MATE domain protein [Shuttleworthia sp. MSX8B]
MKIREIFGDSRFNRRLWHLAWPIALQSLLLASVAAADALMLGLLEQNAMAAVALAAQISFVMSIFILGIASGGSVLAAQYWGKKDPESLDHIFHIMLRIMALVDLVFFWPLFSSPGS